MAFYSRNTADRLDCSCMHVWEECECEELCFRRGSPLASRVMCFESSSWSWRPYAYIFIYVSVLCMCVCMCVPKKLKSSKLKGPDLPKIHRNGLPLEKPG